MRTAILSMALMAGLLTASGVGAAPVVQAAQTPTPVTVADAAPFIGEWTLELQGPNGPGTFDLTVKVEKEKVVGEIAAPTLDTQPITDITKSGENLVLRYMFNYEGNPVDATVQLIPAPEGKTKAQIDFAGGAYIMTGSAAKKEKAK